MTNEPQEIIAPRGYGWYWSDDLNDADWETIGRDPQNPSDHPPSSYGNRFGPILARRKPPEPWTPKFGDRVQWRSRATPGTVMGAYDGWCWVRLDDLDTPQSTHTADLTLLLEAN